MSPRYSTSVAFDSVYVIESIPREDLRTGRELFETTLAPAAALDSGLVVELYEVHTARELLESLSTIAATARRFGRSPIVHIDTHGSRSGVKLSGGERLPWTQLAPRLREINQVSRMNLLVMAATCHGWHVSDILAPTSRAPAFGIIGTQDEVPAGVLLDAMKRFYGVLLSDGHDLRRALDDANGTQKVGRWKFQMLGAELLLCWAFAAYRKSLREESQEARVNQLVAAIASMRNLDVTQTMQLRRAIRADLDDYARWFTHYRTSFLMLDLFPDNERRFPLTLDDCRETTELS